jgi:HEAT repeat protein
VAALLIELLKDPETEVREEAAEGLGRTEVDDPRVRVALTEALKDPQGSVRKEAAEALAQLGLRAGSRPGKE